MNFKKILIKFLIRQPQQLLQVGFPQMRVPYAPQLSTHLARVFSNVSQTNMQLVGTEQPSTHNLWNGTYFALDYFHISAINLFQYANKQQLATTIERQECEHFHWVSFIFSHFSKKCFSTIFLLILHFNDIFVTNISFGLLCRGDNQREEFQLFGSFQSSMTCYRARCGVLRI